MTFGSGELKIRVHTKGVEKQNLENKSLATHKQAARSGAPEVLTFLSVPLINGTGRKLLT